MITVFIRADASLNMGTGHIMRCLVLAECFQNKGALVHFICRQYIGNLCDLIEQRGFIINRLDLLSNDYNPNYEKISSDWDDDAQETYKIVSEIKGKPAWLIVDHYGLDVRWERAIRPLVKRILVIDDLANRQHDCDILIDQNLHLDSNNRYFDLVPESALLFLGPRYAQLRAEFNDPLLLRQRSGVLHTLLVYFGGADPGNQTLKLLDALRLLAYKSFTTTIVLGSIHSNYDLIKSAAEGLEKIRVIGVTDQMGQLMAEADLAVGTCGIAAWERCLLGLPSIVVITAENQREDAIILDKVGAVINLGEADSLGAIDFAQKLEYLGSNREVLKEMALASLSVMDGRENAMREISDVLFE